MVIYAHLSIVKHYLKVALKQPINADAVIVNLSPIAFCHVHGEFVKYLQLNSEKKNRMPRCSVNPAFLNEAEHTEINMNSLRKMTSLVQVFGQFKLKVTQTGPTTATTMMTDITY